MRNQRISYTVSLLPRAYSAATASHRHARWARGIPVHKVSIPVVVTGNLNPIRHVVASCATVKIVNAAVAERLASNCFGANSARCGMHTRKGISTR
ncbi:hypothetical protein PAXRUDRAFT_827292 [Paxillus rubicundulus Ve08.2h10]|uniref:Uncharacterized protein n=1 Tax=Paxillus rubicundulus Ve08.2h10 TaxID=930991 RepID=A0A0D0DY85_9AGAM|nr:hypothetical protein PAXRUDRAFT_827292 [Paxillus rubicundulus Ve08.2h10]